MNIYQAVRHPSVNATNVTGDLTSPSLASLHHTEWPKTDYAVSQPYPKGLDLAAGWYELSLAEAHIYLQGKAM